MSARTTARESSMPLPLREDSEGVASTVATMFTLLVILLFMQLTIVAVVPAQEYNAEWATSRAAIDAFEQLRVDGLERSLPAPHFLGAGVHEEPDPAGPRREHRLRRQRVLHPREHRRTRALPQLSAEQSAHVRQPAGRPRHD